MQARARSVALAISLTQRIKSRARKRWRRLRDSLDRRVPTIFASPVEKFTRAGHNELLLSFNHLKTASTVVEVGGYRGGWGLEMAKRYRCNVEIFEPIKSFASDIRTLANGNEKIQLHEFALGDTDSTATFFLSGDGSGEFRGGQPAEVEIRRPTAQNFPVFGEKISVMLVNIEGGEYRLLSELIENAVIQTIEVLLVQFHRTVPGYRMKRRQLTSQLSRTHTRVFCFFLVWEKWVLKTESAQTG